MCKISDKRNAQGKCKSCNNPNEFGKLCKWHKFKEFAIKTSNLAKDKRKPFGRRPRLVTTEARSFYFKNYIKNRLANGLCSKCSNPRITNTYCLWHYIKNVAHAATVLTKDQSRNNYSMALKGEALNILTQQLIDKLEASDWRCYYTGIKLEIGNLSLDHVLNSADNPELVQDVDNMVWTTKEINYLKNSHSPKQFYDFMLQLEDGIQYLKNNQDFKKYLTE